MGWGADIIGEIQPLQRHEFAASGENTGAQKFYLAQGFQEDERGFADFEGNPWASTKEDLADIKYHCSP